MKLPRAAAVPAAIILLCAAAPAFADSQPAPTPPHGFFGALAAGAAMKPGDIKPATGSAIRLQRHADEAAEPAAHGRVATVRRRRHASHRKTARRGHRHVKRLAHIRSHRHYRKATRNAAAAIPEVAPAAIKSGPHPQLRSLVARYAKEEGIPFALAHGVVMVESRYRPHATGRGGYIGLMQLSYRTARQMGYRGSRAGLYSPETNIRYGVHYLAEAYHQAGGNVCATVSKYQGGTGVHGVTAAGARYCRKVRHYMARLAKRPDIQLAEADRRP
jgi:soluble lytic murein transglycosylase-like protein